MQPVSGVTLSPLPIDAVNLPFLGARTDTHALFQYVLLSQGADETLRLAVPGWVALREFLEPGMKIAFHLPLRLRADFYDEGEITRVIPDDEQGGQQAHVRLTGRSPLRYPVYAEPSSGAVVFNDADGCPADPTELIRALLRDCALTKAGVRVYFRHLVPLFSRITQFPTDEYAHLRGGLLAEIRDRIAANVAAFEDWQEAVTADGFTASDLPSIIELEAVRAAVEPEINNELFGAMFRTSAINQYLNAIRLLERKLCLNYNTLVLLYAAALRA
jgi:hypothetical protein